MQDLDAKAAAVRQVLQPLIKAGTVTGVHVGWAEGSENSETDLPVGKFIVTVTVASDHPEQHYPEIRRMVEQANLPDIALDFEHVGGRAKAHPR